MDTAAATRALGSTCSRTWSTGIDHGHDQSVSYPLYEATVRLQFAVQHVYTESGKCTFCTASKTESCVLTVKSAAVVAPDSACMVVTSHFRHTHRAMRVRSVYGIV